MLKGMVIKNFKCFKNETVFDFRKTKYKGLVQNTCGELVKGALFVGDNASGKTTAIRPLRLLLDLLFRDKDFTFGVYTCFFSKEKTTELKYEFDIEGHDIIYSFSFTVNAIVEEKLEVDSKMLLERLGENAKLYLNAQETFHSVDSSILFLRNVYFNTKFGGNDILVKWFDYLRKSIYINAYSREIDSYCGDNFTAFKYVEKHGVDNLNKFLQRKNFKCSICYDKMVDGEILHFELGEDNGKMIFFKRQGIGEPIPIFLESVGNQTLLNILPAILYAVENSSMLIIDEFSSGLHNKLEELLVKYIMNEGEATQLFFVSHSTNLLSNSILRPDQIYAVELDGNEGSHLYRFSNDQPRVAQNLEKMYLSGVFGGIPEYGTNEK